MKNYILLLCVLLISVLTSSCRDDFNFEPSSGSELSFSKDTIYLDTIFSNIGSSTYNLKVYNKSNKDIKIPSIRLNKGETSSFRLMVDGMAGKSFENVELLANDSLFIFVETTVDIKQQTNGKEFLYTDEILFQSGSQQQTVNLVTLVKDAVFLYPQRFEDGSYESLNFGDNKIYGFFLDEDDSVNGNELEWNNNKPYLIYGYAAVPPGKTLTINEGAEIHFHRNSGLVTFSNATLNAIGSIEHPIVFQGDRLEPSFEDTPGQWNGIWISQDSDVNLSNVIIKNAVDGLFINKNKQPANLYNVQIYNCERNGLLLQVADVIGKNIVTNNCGIAALNINYGGTYDFTHCTFSNYWNRLNQTAVAMNNGDGSNEFALNAHFKNSIIYGNASESLLLLPAHKEVNFNFKFEYSLIKFLNTNKVHNTESFPYRFENTALYNNNLIEESFNEYAPHFKNSFKNQMMITEKATAIIGFGNAFFAQQAPLDISGKNRLSSSDLGAYQHIINVED